jgi:FkbM family methyltransferase
MSLKIALRDAAASVLDLVPYRCLAGVRHSYAVVKPGSAKSRSCAAALAVLRYRHIDPHVEVFALPDAPDVRLSRDNSAITRRLFWYGTRGHEKPVLDLWVWLCSRSHGALEIGANVGYFTVFGARALASGVYVAVEPHPVSSGLLRRNVAANGLMNVQVVEAAVVGGGSPREVELDVPAADPDGAPAGAFLVGVPNAPKGVGARLRVQAVGVTEIFQDAGLIKIDAEGSESDILTGLHAQLRSSRPTLVVEVLDTARSLRPLLGTLARDAEYEILAIGSHGLRSVSPEDLLHVALEKEYATRDVMLLPREQRADLSASGVYAASMGT